MEEGEGGGGDGGGVSGEGEGRGGEGARRVMRTVYTSTMHYAITYKHYVYHCIHCCTAYPGIR